MPPGTSPTAAPIRSTRATKSWPLSRDPLFTALVSFSIDSIASAYSGRSSGEAPFRIFSMTRERPSLVSCPKLSIAICVTEGSAKFEVMLRTSPPSLLVNSTTDASVNRPITPGTLAKPSPSSRTSNWMFADVDGWANPLIVAPCEALARPVTVTESESPRISTDEPDTATASSLMV